VFTKLLSFHKSAKKTKYFASRRNGGSALHPTMAFKAYRRP